jgi:hypothetical protein
MTTSTVTVSRRPTKNATWLRLVQVCLAVSVVPLVVFAVAGTFYTTISEGDFKYNADYWYTGAGLPITLAGIGIVLGVHALQHGADGRLGTIGVWVNTVALVELFAQLLASVVQGTEVRWGPSYPVFTLLTFVGVAMLAAGSWRTGILPRWMLGSWPVVWVLGCLAAPQGPTPLLLAAFYVVLGVTLTRRVRTDQRAPL